MRRPYYIVAAAVTLVAISLVLRWYSSAVITDDYTYFLRPWFETLQFHSGLSAFQNLFSDYSPLYLYLLKLLTLLPFPSLLSIKALSLVGDIFLGMVVAGIVKKVRPEIGWNGELLVFATVFALPTVLMNSSLWGQCDSLYAGFVLLSLYYSLHDRPLLATLAFAVGFCFKVQSIFFLPVLVGYLWRRDGGELGYLLLVPLVYGVSIIPAWLGGGSFAQLFFIYLHQSGEYQSLALAAPSVFAFFNNFAVSAGVQNLLAISGLIAGGIAAVGIIFLIKYAIADLTYRRLLFAALLSVLILPFLLPRMHERYFYLADIIAVTYAFSLPRRWYVAVGVVLVSTLSYLPYLSKGVPEFGLVNFDFRWLAALLLVIIGGLVLPLFRQRYLSTGAA